jgi:hypothetical protein
MPRLSLWKTIPQNDYKYFDKIIKEMFVVGGTDLYIHKYLGTNNPANSTDATQPHYDETKPTNIQDLLFLENRDRKYSQNIYRLRGHYNVQNLDFDLSQFGLFLTSDIIFITVHYNEMLDIIGRKLMVGDVFELPHLEDFHPLNTDIPVGLRRFYQITDTNYASEGFSPTWFPHLWRLKCEPLVNSQEFQDILLDPINKDNYMGEWDPNTTYQPGYTVKYGDKIYTPVKEVPAGVNPPNAEYWRVSEEQNLVDIVTTYKTNLAINQAVINEAKRVVPLSGYDTSNLYIVPTFVNNIPAPPINLIVPSTPASGRAVLTPQAGRIEVIRDPNYKYGSAVVRIPSGFTLGQNPFTVVTMSPGLIEPFRTDAGSGQVFPDLGLAVTVFDDGPATGPYGTADNTYATADQYIDFILTALPAPAKSVVIPFEGPVPNELTLGLVIRATVYSENGTPSVIFQDGTTIIAIDRELNTIAVSLPTLAAVADGTALEISYNFDGIISDVMDFRADCDPSYQFIKRFTPRNFSWLNGYMTGDGKAPNGEPFKSGIAFPPDAKTGDYFLRIDYVPQLLFRFDGYVWWAISQNVRTDTGFTEDDFSQLSRFINDKTRTKTSDGGTIPVREGLNEILRLKPDK